MKQCEFHPDRDANGYCSSCGRAVCDRCADIFDDPRLCPECKTTWGSDAVFREGSSKIEGRPIDEPLFTGSQSGGLFLLGIVGALAGFAYSAMYLVALQFLIDFESMQYGAIMSVAAPISLVSSLLVAVGFYGMYKKYGDTLILYSLVLLGISALASFLFPYGAVFDISILLLLSGLSSIVSALYRILLGYGLIRINTRTANPRFTQVLGLVLILWIVVNIPFSILLSGIGLLVLFFFPVVGILVNALTLLVFYSERNTPLEETWHY